MARAEPVYGGRHEASGGRTRSSGNHEIGWLAYLFHTGRRGPGLGKTEYPDRYEERMYRPPAGNRSFFHPYQPRHAQQGFFEQLSDARYQGKHHLDRQPSRREAITRRTADPEAGGWVA